MELAAAVGVVRRAARRRADGHHSPVDITCGDLNLGHDVMRGSVERNHVSVVPLRPRRHLLWHGRGVDPDHALGVVLQQRGD